MTMTMGSMGSMGWAENNNKTKGGGGDWRKMQKTEGETLERRRVRRQGERCTHPCLSMHEAWGEACLSPNRWYAGSRALAYADRQYTSIAFQ